MNMKWIQAFKERWSAPSGYKEVLHVGLPLVASMASATVMQFTDRLFLSHYSVTAIAAAMPGGVTALAIQLTLMGLCGYVSVFIAHHVGAGMPGRIGSMLWQGIWLALFSALVALLPVFVAAPLFAWAGHAAEIQQQEVIYFQILMLGTLFFLLNSVVSGFFIGRGYTRPVFLANLAGALLNIPLDYMLIFGLCGLPELGIAGAGIATVLGWVFCTAILSLLVFTKKNDLLFGVFRSWRIKIDLLLRLVRFGVPSGINLFMEVIGFTWFVLEMGRLGEVALAASNIAFSINSLVFTPMLGLNNAVAALVGQAMGRKDMHQAKMATSSTLHISFAYMLPLALCFVVFGGELMDLFRPSGAGDFAAVRATGVLLLYYVAIYSLLDSFNIVYLGALKGAGDTFAVMFIMGGTAAFTLVLPILILQHTGNDTLHSLWIVLTIYVCAMATCARYRFSSGKWQKIKLV